MSFFSPSEQSEVGAREKPLCIALIICNEVIEDARTGNKTLVGLFNGILAPQLPATHPRMFLMASLTSGAGDWPFSFVVTGPEGQKVFQMEDQVRLGDPLSVCDLIIELRNLPLEREGVYFVDLVLDGTPLANRRFTVQVSPEGALPYPGSGSG